MTLCNAVLHFGTHGSLEFMPGKQVGLSGQCWPDRLIADLPGVYLYAANNPSEGLIAKRRAASTLISYLTRPLHMPTSTATWWTCGGLSITGDSDLLT